MSAVAYSGRSATGWLAGDTDASTSGPAADAETTTEEVTAEATTEEVTAEATTEAPTTEEAQTPEAIPNAGEVVKVSPELAVPFYDFDQDFDHPPHVADITVTKLDWEFTPFGNHSSMCDYDPAKGTYLAVYLEAESNDKARSSGSPWSSDDLIITDDQGELAAEYQDATLMCTDIDSQFPVEFKPNEHYEGPLVYLVEPDATQLRLDFAFDRDEERVAPVFVWELADF